MERHATYRRDDCAQHSDNELECQAQFQRDANRANWWWELKTDVTTWSEQLYRIAGRDPEATLPSFKEHSCFYTAESWHRLTTATVTVLQTGQPYQLELQMRRPDGTRRRVLGSGEAVRDANGDILRLRGTVEDVSDRNWRVIQSDEPEDQVNDERRIKAIIRAQDEENIEIARELQDHINQKLCLLAVDIQGLAVDFSEMPQQAHLRIEELWQKAAEIVDDINRVSNQLHPSIVDLLGLPVAIRGLCREFAIESGISVECICTNVVRERIAKDVALSFFHALREALANIAGRGRGVDVNVELVGNSTELRLRVSGAGVGSQSEKANDRTDLAFTRMKERLRSIGGEMEVWSTPTGGMRIEARARLRASTE